METLKKIGDTATYIQDHKEFRQLFSLPKEVALEWVKANCPETDMMPGRCKGKDLTIENMVENGWLNKLFIIVQIADDKKYAITNWDGRFYLYASPQ